MKKTFYANGKLLITAEYLVLDGAKALALPTKFGQFLDVEKCNNQQIVWQSFDYDGTLWFEDTIDFQEISNYNKNENNNVKNTLIAILHHAYILNPDFLKLADGYKITTRLTFPKSWGLGTSSTLISTIAQWLQIDAYKLLNNSFGGSGYDIACAQNNHPIVYHLVDKEPIIESASFNPQFSEHLYFVYLNKKQNSKEAIASYRKKQNELVQIIPVINQITDSLLQTTELAVFIDLLVQHENLLSEILGIKPVKKLLFPDFNGAIKSLGAWGGDFILVAASENPTDYFVKKGHATIIRFKDMVL